MTPDGSFSMMLLINFVILAIYNNGVSTAAPDRIVFDKLLINSTYCKIPDVPLLPKAIEAEWKIKVKTVCEPQSKYAVISGDGMLSLTDEADGLDCCLAEIQRPYKFESDDYRLSDCRNLNSETSIDVSALEFMMVNCTKDQENHQPKELPPQFLHIFPKSNKIQAKLNFWNKFGKKKPRPFSITFIILDSISRTHAYRGLPLTMPLINKLGFIDYKAYHTLGEPTIENYIPLMLGRITNDSEGWDRRPPNYNDGNGKWDDMPFIWKNFSSTNFITMNVEDSPNWHTFNFNGRKGFTYKPFDYLTRAYMLAQGQLKFYHSKAKYHVQFGETAFSYYSTNCMDGQNMWNFVFNYTMEFFNQYSPAVVPTFSITFISWPHHDYLFGIKQIDQSVLELFKNLSSKPDILDNSFLFFMADHGFRWSNYSETQEGLLERDLPMLFIRPPDRFVKKYPKLAANLKSNADKVTTHIDLFKTMAHLNELTIDEFFEDDKAFPPKGSRSYGWNRKYGKSLLNEISANRSCEDAQILPAFCSCGYPTHSKDFEYKKYKKYIVVEGFEKERG